MTPQFIIDFYKEFKEYLPGELNFYKINDFTFKFFWNREHKFIVSVPRDPVGHNRIKSIVLLHAHNLINELFV